MNAAYLGIDCGSVGVKAVLLDANDRVLKAHYLRNQGVLDTVSDCLKEVIDHHSEIKAVGVTGSGRNFVNLLVGADVVKTEILAHAIGALSRHPQAQTILDIGGEDCKIMKIRNGILEDYIMNSVCGAGTGSVIDSIASRMGIPIETVGDIALKSKNRLSFPGKCGVFTQSSVVSRLNSGANKSDILMGVLRALVSNYLMLGKQMQLEPPFVFQGATSRNKALVKALREELDSEVIVPDEAPFMGAIGAAIFARKAEPKRSNFRGDISKLNLRTKSFSAHGCDNRCELTILYENKTIVGFIGNRCDNCAPKIRSKPASLAEAKSN
ncbi:acyl-CoA dehydratase activase [Pelagicoccus mobilis]|uniref:ATPase BadF/BadG/BcrA/BcrD type domain-containing protein n=1 Tax=Pelagicoccus mobilis TaxID=415221 RepID=A0A934RVY2_9BACT|nr:acyl-CoA dehydratase activase [Pelagicoccus mobilis]MBK1877363.1 hypothetical protein [Pelagicoccus mobilis]